MLMPTPGGGAPPRYIWPAGRLWKDRETYIGTLPSSGSFCTIAFSRVEAFMLTLYLKGMPIIAGQIGLTANELIRCKKREERQQFIYPKECTQILKVNLWGLVNFQMYMYFLFFFIYCMVGCVYCLLSSFCQCQFNLTVAKTTKSYFILSKSMDYKTI